MRHLALNHLYLALALLAAACSFERQPGRMYTDTGTDLGAANWHPITTVESQVSFTGADPTKLREGLVLRDRYIERLTFKNNAQMRYARLYAYGFVSSANDEESLAEMANEAFFKDKGIVFDKAKVRSTARFKYLTQSSSNYTCFLFHGLFWAGEPGYGGSLRPGSPGNTWIAGNICAPAGSALAGGLESEMLGILARAQFDGGAGNRAAASPPPG